jgi:type I restriction-modification system DNA methylase subunit
MPSDKILEGFGIGITKTTGHATESTILDIFLGELAKKLKVLTQVSYQQLSGRKQPDVTIGEKQDYFIEAEWEGNENKGLVQAARYQTLGGKGVFVVCFPNKLKRAMPRETLIKMAKNARFSGIAVFNDERNEDFYKGSLDGLLSWISAHAQQEIVVKEVKTSEVIALIRNSVDYISSSLAGVNEENIDAIFGGKSVFENILQYESKQYPLKEMRKGAAYLLVNQILFYHLLSKSRSSDFQELDEDNIQSFTDLQGYFEHVLKVDYRPTFGFKIATKLPPTVLAPVKEAINIIKALKPEKIRQDILGKIFHDLIPFEVRKSVAAFYTNNEAAALLAKLSIDKAGAEVIDLACGSGTLLVSAYRRKKELLIESGQEYTAKAHAKFLEQDLTGVDIMPFAAHLAAVHLSLQAPLYETQRVRLAVWDSTEPTVRPGHTIPTISRELKKAYANPKLDVFSDQTAANRHLEVSYIKKGVVTPEGVGGDALPLKPVDVVIMNPPFTRQERLPEAYKEKLTERFRHYSEAITGQIGLHGYFILLADAFLKEGGKIAFVLPATILRLQSMDAIRRFLVKNYRIDYVISTEQRSAFSESAKFREILLVATKTTAFKDSKCLFANLKRIPVDESDASFFAEEVMSSKKSEEKIDDSDLSTFTVTQSELERSVENWFKFIANTSDDTLLERREKEAPNTFKSLREMLALNKGKIIRGIEHWSGSPVSVSSAFILRSESHAMKQHDKWIVKEIKETYIVSKERILGTEVIVPKKCTTFVLRRPSGLRSIDISDELDFAVISRFENDQHFFIKGLEKKGRNVSFYVKLWRKYLESRLTNLVISRRFDISAPNTIGLAFYSNSQLSPAKMFWAIRGIENDDAKILALWFNSTINIEQVLTHRAETRGAFMGLDQYILQDFLVPDLNGLTCESRKRLLSLFDQVTNIPLPSILDQLKNKNKIRRQIDQCLLEIFDLQVNLDDYYESIIQKIQILATIMKEGILEKG